MKDVPLNAIVNCSDGYCGRSTSVIVDPDTLQVTYYAVKEDDAPYTEWLVPVEQVEESTPTLLKLRCTKNEMKNMQPFTVAEFRQIEIPRYVGADTAVPYTFPEIVTTIVEEEVVPKGQVAVRQGVKVEATDGPVGKVKSLVSHSKSGEITHFTMTSDPTFSKKDVVIPLSALDRYDGETVYLKIDKKTLSTMLAVPSQPGYGVSNMEMVIVLLNAADTADAALATLKQLPRKKGVRLFNVAVLNKDKDGKIAVSETEDVYPRQGAIFGAITGGIIGLLGGPVGAIVGAAAGAATGRTAAKRIDMGFTDEYLKQFQESLQPGDSMLLILVERDGVDNVKEALSGFTEKVWRQMLTGDLFVQLTTAEEDESPG